MVVCCHCPNKSTNLKSTTFTPCFSANFSTSAGVIVFFPPTGLTRTHHPLLEGVFSAFAGPDPDDLFDRLHENLSIADVARAGDTHQRLYHILDHLVLHDDL